MIGELGILNVAAGDTKLTFDPRKPAEVRAASKTVKDMIRRGYAILIEVGRDDKGPLYRRALDFDAETAEYIIAGTPEEEAEEDARGEASAPPPRRERKKATAPKRVAATATSAIAVARTAGG